MDKLNLLKLFVLVIDKGSFVSASSSLGLSPSTVSKAIQRLEQDLQLQLFYRTTRKLTLTEGGRNYAKTVRALIFDLERCEAELASSNMAARGRLILNVPISYGRVYILPLLAKFKALYPEIEIDISFDDAYVDMVEQRVDLCIRTGMLEDSNLVAKQLSPMDFITCASPDFLKQHPKIKPEDYNDYPWIRFRFKQSGRLMPILSAQGKELVNLDPGKHYIVDDGEAMISLCTQGLGLTQVPQFLARDSIKRKDLLPVLPFIRHPNFAVRAIYAKREFLPTKIRVFIDFLVEELERSGEGALYTWAESL